MRKAQKAQADDFVKTLEQAHGWLRELIESRDMKKALILLQDCQEGAAALGNMIEQFEGGGFITASMLEEYCELVYQIHNKLLSGGEMGANQAYKMLRQQMVRIADSVANDIAVRKEVVFLPYKASMWDSLESVWREADADPDCDAYVIPIPYYDKNPDGSFGEMHYEGSQYPEYVPVVPYDSYDLETRRPDMVFIHSPYDDCNYVTSVSPRFYSENLRNYTDQLIYVPYFVLGESMYESMCVTPGTLLADHVIAHSGRAKDDYIKYLKAFYVKNMGMKEKEVETMLCRRILPLGSPKIDKVVNSKRNDYGLPEEWRKRLVGKKAVLYNTGVAGILNGNEQELKKIKDTIAFFARCEDVVLWWRPHPLTGATVQSMRHHLFDEYLQIVEEYQRSGVGIYDDTADLHRALLWTDMYYGDDSSVIYLYGVQGKPIVMQNIHCLAADAAIGTASGIRYRISCEAAGSVYFFALEYNRLYRLDVSDGRIAAVADAPSEQQMESSLYSGIFFQDGTIWLVPSRARALAAYHPGTGEWERYELPDRIKSYTRTEDKLYMLSSDYKSLWCMDLHEKKLERREICYQWDGKFHKSEESYSVDSYLAEGKLYYLIAYTNMIAVYDMESGQACLVQIGSEENQYQRMAYDGSCFWLLPYGEKTGVVCWDGKRAIEGDADGYPKGFSAPFGFKNFVCGEDDLWLFPYRGNEILCFHKNTKRVSRILEADQIFGAEAVDIDNVLVLSDGRIAVSAYKAGEGACIALLDDSYRLTARYSCICTDEKQLLYSRVFDRLETEKYASVYAYQISEGDTYTLGRVCDALAKSDRAYPAMREYFRSVYANSDGTAGAHIWEEVNRC